MSHVLPVRVPLQPTFETFSGTLQDISRGASTSYSPFQYREPRKTMNKRNWGPPTMLIVRRVAVTEKEPTTVRPKLSERLLSIPAST
jgi:hypothetical protein